MPNDEFRLPNRPRQGRSYIPVLAFLVGFTVLIIFVSYYYLFPALEAASTATPREKKGLGAYSWLLMSVILFILISGMLLTFRIGRFFFPRQSEPRVRTKYVDAWSEAGKRAQVEPEDDET